MKELEKCRLMVSVCSWIGYGFLVVFLYVIFVGTLIFGSMKKYEAWPNTWLILCLISSIIANGGLWYAVYWMKRDVRDL